jgi:hypothetical protein
MTHSDSKMLYARNKRFPRWRVSKDSDQLSAYAKPHKIFGNIAANPS